MKKVAFLFSCLLIFSGYVSAQSYKDFRANTNMQRFDQKTIDKFKETTTVFFYSRDMLPQLDSIKQAVSDGWKLTPLIFDDIASFERYASDPKYSYFIIERILSRIGAPAMPDRIYYCLILRMTESVTKKGHAETIPLCRMDLFADYLTMSKGAGIPRFTVDINQLYQKGAFYNFSPVLLRAQLTAVSSDLMNRMKPSAFAETRDENLGGILSKDTLYVPKRLLNYFRGVRQKEEIKEESFFEGYRYKYRICSDAELFDIFQTQKRGRLIFEFTQVSSGKFITIYDLKQKKIIYRDVNTERNDLKQQDIEKIVAVATKG